MQAPHTYSVPNENMSAQKDGSLMINRTSLLPDLSWNTIHEYLSAPDDIYPTAISMSLDPISYLFDDRSLSHFYKLTSCLLSFPLTFAAFLYSMVSDVMQPKVLIKIL